jgi:hypothetical protein
MGSSLKDRKAMRTQTKRLNETPPLSPERSGTVSCRTQYQGYRLMARAEPVRSALHAAHLVIEAPCYPTQRCFNALDYFYDPALAVQYAIRWGRIWVEHRLTNVAVQRVISTKPASNAALLLHKERTTPPVIIDEPPREKTLRFIAREPGSSTAALAYWLGVTEPSSEASLTELTRRFAPLMQVVFPDDRPGAFVNRSALLAIHQLGTIDRLVFVDGSSLDVWNDRACADICNLHSSLTHSCCLSTTRRSRL